MSASIEASLRLEIAQYQAALAKAQGDIQKFRTKSVSEVDAVGRAHQQLAATMKNPWVTASIDAKKYVGTLMEAEKWTEQLQRNHAKLASYKGPQTAAANPWGSAGSAQYAAQQAERDRVARRNADLDAFRGRGGEDFDTNRLLWQQAQAQRANAGGMRGRGFGGGGGGGMNLGMAAMQAQDIAIQLQMGTRASIVLAQQGSQLLSVFGPGGMLLGGAVAIGGAFFLMGEKATEAFRHSKQAAADFDDQMKVNLLGSSRELADTFTQIQKNIRTATDELSGLNSTFAVTANLADIFGGPTVEERINAAAEQLNKSGEHAVAVANRLIETSATEVKIAELRAAGAKEQADEMQRQLDLEREIARIQAMKLPRSFRDQLAADATARSQLEGGRPRDLAREKEEIARIEARIREEKIKALDPQERYVELAKEQDAIFASMATKGGLFFEQSMEGLQAWAEAKKQAGDTSGYLEVLKMLEKARELQEQMADAAKGVADARGDRDKKNDARLKEEEDAAAARQSEIEDEILLQGEREKGLATLREEIALLQAKAAGNDALVERMERELRIREKAKQIEEQTGIAAAQARRAAEQMIALEDQAAGKDQQSGGAKGMKKTWMGSKGGGGLVGFDRLQNSPFGADSLSGRRNSAVPAHWMGGYDQGGLSERARRNADSADARESRQDSGAMDLGSKILNVLTLGLDIH